MIRVRQLSLRIPYILVPIFEKLLIFFRSYQLGSFPNSVGCLLNELRVALEEFLNLRGWWQLSNFLFFVSDQIGYIPKEPAIIEKKSERPDVGM